MATFANLDTAEDHLITAGLPSDQIAALIDQARDVLIFTRRLLPDAEVPPGTSKLGGSPDLPPGMAWPTRAPYPDAPQMIAQLARTFGPTGYAPNAARLAFFEAHLSSPQPLAFLAQLDLEMLAQTGPFDIGIPATGRLLVFVDRASFSVGATAMDDGWIQVIHDTSGTPGVRTQAPEALIKTLHAHFLTEHTYLTETTVDLSHCERLSPHAAITLPMPRAFDPPAVYDTLTEAHLADFTHLMGGHAPDGEQIFSDQLGGHPQPIHNDVARDLFTAAEPRLRPTTLAEQNGRWDPYRWDHILSVGGESYMEHFPASWGDGDLYIAHRSDPARPEGLGQVWAISQ